MKKHTGNTMNHSSEDLPAHDPIDAAPGRPLPADHAEKCRRMAKDMAFAERLMYRLANGDKDAARQLTGLCNSVPYDGSVLMWRVDPLLASVLEKDDSG